MAFSRDEVAAIAAAWYDVIGPHLHVEACATPNSDVDPLAYLRAQGVTV
ncbi:hypothetical protein [Streptacidiphilus rugosus]|nr:hypothetical protein [Streptacidiphilus rugosus]